MATHPNYDNTLNADNFYEQTDWSEPLLAAAAAMYGRLNVNNPEKPTFDNLDIDALDHYCIAAQHAVRAFYRAADPA